VKSFPTLIPDAPVVSEESAELNDQDIAARRWFWLVDPLDGTKEFLKGTNEFTVNLALIEAGATNIRSRSCAGLSSYLLRIAKFQFLAPKR
jgi:3'-phosphoadenosine 5'-phosphosulfate (PAPS) 3'-phosphatase